MANNDGEEDDAHLGDADDHSDSPDDDASQPHPEALRAPPPLPAYFLDPERTPVRAVARIEAPSPQNPGRVTVGTGVLIAPRLLLTCQHVLPTDEDVLRATFDFNYSGGQVATWGAERRYRADRQGLVWRSAHWDCLVLELEVAAEQHNFPIAWSRSLPLEGAWVNVLHHPQGLEKGFSRGQIQSVAEGEVTYLLPTFDGSSGAPVCVEESETWEMVALHRGSHGEGQSGLKVGIPLHTILADLPPPVQARVQAAQAAARPPRRPGQVHHLPMAPSLPSGTVTFLFTDIEGSTRLLQHLGDRYAEVLADHQRLLRQAFSEHGGVEVDTQGDSFFVAFPTAPGAVAAAAAATRALAEHPWPEGSALRVRMGLHTGIGTLYDGHYIGLDVHQTARIAAAGHGGQILLSSATCDLAKHALPEGVTLRDLGTHRLKDLQEPEPLYQLVLPGLPVAFPPLKTLDAHPNNLPIQSTPLLGREEPVAAVCSLLRRDEVRLVTLTGLGGIGKTRLAIQIAAELVEDFADGIWFVRLSRLVDPGLVLPTVAQTLGLKEQSSQPIAEMLSEYLHTKRVLLVLDNFEQVVGAAAEVAALRESAPHLKVLVTSRVCLHLRGEQEYPLGPLSLPDPGHLPAPEGLTQYAAVALFIERARGARPDFTVTAANAPAIGEICARLDGLPLAIELAAAKVKLLPPEALLSRLSTRLTLLTGGARDLEERQQTMRNTLAWSEALLAPEEQVLFRRLAVFAGGCTLEAAEAVCAPAGAEPLGLEVLEGLGTLVDHSLVQQRQEDGEPRFSMLHVIREYALEQLEASGEAEPLRQAHLAYLVAVVELVNFREVRGLQGTYWLARLECEQDNLRAALAWAAAGGEVDLGLRLAVAAMGYWNARGAYREAGAWLDQLLAARPEDQGLDATLVWALGSAGVCAANQGDLERGVTLMEQGLAGARTIGDASGVAVGLQLLGSYMLTLGDTTRGLALLDESLVEARRLDDDVDSMLNTVVQAADNLLLVPGQEGRAVKLATEAVESAQRAGKPYYELRARRVLSFGALQRGDLVQAEEQALRALRKARDQDQTLDVLWGVESVSLVAGRKGHALKSARLLGAVASLQETTGIAGDPKWQAAIEAMVAPARAALGEEQWAAAFAAGRALTLEEAVAEALGDVDEGERPST